MDLAIVSRELPDNHATSLHFYRLCGMPNSYTNAHVRVAEERLGEGPFIPLLLRRRQGRHWTLPWNATSFEPILQSSPKNIFFLYSFALHLLPGETVSHGRHHPGIQPFHQQTPTSPRDINVQS
jgi:hypothetical protein